MHRLPLACALLAALTLAGCSDDVPEGSPDPTPSTGPGTTTDGNATASATTTTTASTSSGTTGAPRPAQTLQKDVRDNAFPEGTFTVQKGDKVVWTHRGTSPHSITADAGSPDAFDSHANCPPVCLLAGQTYEHTFDAVGEVPYHCKVHGSMTGTITVVDALPA